jgi:hypothetical protein
VIADYQSPMSSGRKANMPAQRTCSCKPFLHLFRTERKRADLSPGWVHTGLTGANDGGPKPNGAWTPEQTVDYMTDKIFNHGDFYVICPDNETSTVSLVSPDLGFVQNRVVNSDPSPWTKRVSCGVWAISSRTDRHCRGGIQSVSA